MNTSELFTDILIIVMASMIGLMLPLRITLTSLDHLFSSPWIMFQHSILFFNAVLSVCVFEEGYIFSAFVKSFSK